MNFSDFWDTAGQEKFQSMHPSYYHQAHACILVFDATRKNTYKSLSNWYAEMRNYRPSIPCICAVNKIDGKYSVHILNNPNFPITTLCCRNFQNLKLRLDFVEI